MSDSDQRLFSDEIALVTQEDMPTIFDYRLLSEENREFVMQKTDETQMLLKRTAEKIIEIGKNLLDVQEILPHGMFLPWLQSEFDMSKATAYKFINVARKFDGKFLPSRNLPATALYLLSSPSTPDEAIDETLQRAGSGEKITKALVRQIIDAQEEIKKVQDAEAEARADAQVAQESLFKTEQELTNQIETLKKEMDKLVKPEVQIKEVEKEVTPPAVTAQLAAYDEQVKRLNEERAKIISERDSEKVRADKFAKRFVDELPERQQKEANERIRAQWHALATEFQSTVKHLISEWPTLLDTRAFDTDEWAEVDIIREASARVAGECDRLRHKAENVFVDANGSIESYALSVVE